MSKLTRNTDTPDNRNWWRWVDREAREYVVKHLTREAIFKAGYRAGKAAKLTPHAAWVAFVEGEK